MAAEAPPRGVWLVVVALIAATLMALAAYAVAIYLLGADLDLLPTLVTALVVGAFLSLFLARPVQKRTTFTVEREVGMEMEEEVVDVEKEGEAG